ncbi:hypothetical protein AHF37_00850 [Paragonimus kellicotti]|nr:hypothetical protein AHF37_00850 [Paragonimus kellicotti]
MDDICQTEVPSTDLPFAHQKVRNGPLTPCSGGSPILNPKANPGFGSGDKVQTLCMKVSQVDSERNSNELPSTDSNSPDIQTQNTSPVDDIQAVMHGTNIRKQDIRQGHEKNRLSEIRKNKRSKEADGEQCVQIEDEISHLDSHEEQTGCFQSVETELECTLLEVSSRCKSAPSSIYRRKRDISSNEVKSILKANCLKSYFLNHFQLNVMVPIVNMKSYHVYKSCAAETKLAEIQSTAQEGSDNQIASNILEHAVYLKDRPTNRTMPPTHFQKFIRPSSEQRKTKNLRHNLEFKRHHNWQPIEKQTICALQLKANRPIARHMSIKQEYVKPVRKSSFLNELLVNVCNAVGTDEQLDRLKSTSTGYGQLNLEPPASTLNHYLATGIKNVIRELDKHRERCECESSIVFKGYNLVDYPPSFLDGNTLVNKYPEHAAMEDDQDNVEVKVLNESPRLSTHYPSTEKPNIQRGTCNRSSPQTRFSLQPDNEIIEFVGSSDGFDYCGSNGINDSCVQCWSSNKMSTMHHLFNGPSKTDQRLEVISVFSQDNVNNSTSVSNTLAFCMTLPNSSDVSQKYSDEDGDKDATNFTYSKVNDRTFICVPEVMHLLPYRLYSEPVHYTNSDCVLDPVNFHSPFSHTHIAVSENIERHDDSKSARTQFDLNSRNNCNHPGRHGKQILIDDTDCKSAQTMEMYTSQEHRDLLCILLPISRDDFTQSANASSKTENSIVTHNFAQDTVQTLPAVNNLVDYAQKIARIKGVQWFSVVGALTTNEGEQLSTRSFWIKTNEPQPTNQPSCSNHVQSKGKTLQHYVQATSQNSGTEDFNGVRCDDPQFKIQSADSTTSKTSKQCPQNEMSPTITLKADKVLGVDLSSPPNSVQLCPADVNVRLFLDVRFPLKSDTTNEPLHSAMEKSLPTNVGRLDNKQINFPSNTNLLLQPEKPCKQDLQQDGKHSKKSNDSLDYAERSYASDSPITSIRTISLSLSVGNPPKGIREEPDTSFMSGESVNIVDTPLTVSSMAPAVDAFRKSVKNSEHTFESNMPNGYANQPGKISSELCVGMAHEGKVSDSPKEIPVDYSLSSTNSKGIPECCTLTDNYKSATNCADVPISDSPANMATPPYVSDFKNLVLEQDTQQAAQSPQEKAEIKPNVTNRTSPTLITTELYYSRDNWLPNTEDPAFSHISYTQGASYCVPDPSRPSNLSSLLLQHYTSAEALYSWLGINHPKKESGWKRKLSPMTTSMYTASEHNDRTQPKLPTVMHLTDSMEVLNGTKHSYIARTNHGLSPHDSVPNERINDIQSLNAVDKDTVEYRSLLLTPNYEWFPNKQIDLPASPSFLEHQPTFLSTPAAEPSLNEKKVYSSAGRKLGKELLDIFENRPAMDKPSEGNLSTLTENDRSSSRLQKAQLAPSLSEFSSDKCSLNIPNVPIITQHAIPEIQSAKSSEKISKSNLSNFTRKTADHPHVIRTTQCSQTLSSKSSSGFLGTPPKSPRRRWPSSRPQKPSQSENTSLTDLTEQGDPVTNKRALFTRSVMYTYSRRMCTRLFPATVDPEQISPSVAKPTGTGATFDTQRPQSAPTGAKQYSRRTVIEHSPSEASIEQLDSDYSQRETSVKSMANPPHDKATILTCLCVANMATLTSTPMVDNLSELVKQLKTLASETKSQQILQKQIVGSQRVPIDQQQATVINSSKLNDSIDRALQTENFHASVAPGSNPSKAIYTQTSSVNVCPQVNSAQTNQLLSNQLQITTKLETQNADGQLNDPVCRNGLHTSNKISPIISVSAHLDNVTQANLGIGVDCSYTVPCHNVKLTADQNTVNHLLLCRPTKNDPGGTQSKRTYTPNVETFKASINKCTEIPDRLQRLDTDVGSQMLGYPPVPLSVTTHLVPKYMSETHKSKSVSEEHVCLRALLDEGEEDYVAAPDDGLSGVKRIVNAGNNPEIEPQRDSSPSCSTVTHSRVEWDLPQVQRDRTTRKTESTAPMNSSRLQTENAQQHITLSNFHRGPNVVSNEMTTKPGSSANPSLGRVIDLRHQLDNDHRIQRIDGGFSDMPAISSVKDGCAEKGPLSTSMNKWISLADCLDENGRSAQHTDSNSGKRGKSPEERTMTAFGNSDTSEPNIESKLDRRRVVTSIPQPEHSNKTYTSDHVSTGPQENASLCRQVLDQCWEETFLLNEAMEVDLDVLDRLTRPWIGGTRKMGQKSGTHHIPTKRPDKTNKQNNAAHWHFDPKSVSTTSDFSCNRLSRQIRNKQSVQLNPDFVEKAHTHVDTHGHLRKVLIELDIPVNASSTTKSFRHSNHMNCTLLKSGPLSSDERNVLIAGTDHTRTFSEPQCIQQAWLEKAPATVTLTPIFCRYPTANTFKSSPMFTLMSCLGTNRQSMPMTSFLSSCITFRTKHMPDTPKSFGTNGHNTNSPHRTNDDKQHDRFFMLLGLLRKSEQVITESFVNELWPVHEQIIFQEMQMPTTLLDASTPETNRHSRTVLINTLSRSAPAGGTSVETEHVRDSTMQTCTNVKIFRVKRTNSDTGPLWQTDCSLVLPRISNSRYASSFRGVLQECDQNFNFIPGTLWIRAKRLTNIRPSRAQKRFKLASDEYRNHSLPVRLPIMYISNKTENHAHNTVYGQPTLHGCTTLNEKATTMPEVDSDHVDKLETKTQVPERETYVFRPSRREKNTFSHNLLSNSGDLLQEHERGPYSAMENDEPISDHSVPSVHSEPYIRSDLCAASNGAQKIKHFVLRYTNQTERVRRTYQRSRSTDLLFDNYVARWRTLEDYTVRNVDNSQSASVKPFRIEQTRTEDMDVQEFYTIAGVSIRRVLMGATPSIQDIDVDERSFSLISQDAASLQSQTQHSRGTSTPRESKRRSGSGNTYRASVDNTRTDLTFQIGSKTRIKTTGTEVGQSTPNSLTDLQAMLQTDAYPNRVKSSRTSVKKQYDTTPDQQKSSSYEKSTKPKYAKSTHTPRFTTEDSKQKYKELPNSSDTGFAETYTSEEYKRHSVNGTHAKQTVQEEKDEEKHTKRTSADSGEQFTQVTNTIPSVSTTKSGTRQPQSVIPTSFYHNILKHNDLISTTLPTSPNLPLQTEGSKRLQKD